jgi:hypothetical protein
MDKYYVLVAGSGTSSRANIEALIEDHVYANGPDVVFVLPFKDKINQGQLFLAQYAKDKGKELIVFAPPSADLSTTPSASFSPSENPLSEAINFVKGERSWVFLLWNDEDAQLVQAVNICADANLKVYDLTDGLNLIGRTEPVEITIPVIPEAEQVQLTLLDELEDDEDDFEDEVVEDEEDEDELIDVMYSLVDTLTEIVTKRALKRIEELYQDAPKKPSKGSEA